MPNRITVKPHRIMRLFGVSDAGEVSAWLRRHLYECLCEEVCREANILRPELQHGYPGSSRWSSIRSRAGKAVVLFHRVPEEGVIEEERRGAFAFLGKIAAMGEEDAEVFRERYLRRCKEAYADLFDRIESNPLTESQREACSIDEDNNLVLAGAGTGKTSTMVGRASSRPPSTSWSKAISQSCWRGSSGRRSHPSARNSSRRSIPSREGSSRTGGLRPRSRPSAASVAERGLWWGRKAGTALSTAAPIIPSAILGRMGALPAAGR